MDNYKFGNSICSMREARNMTQKELALQPDVSDKAIMCINCRNHSEKSEISLTPAENANIVYT